MILKLDGNLDIGAQVWSEIDKGSSIFFSGSATKRAPTKKNNFF